MRAYHKRNIRFAGTEEQELWTLKYYKVTVDKEFQSNNYFKYVKTQIPILLEGAIKHHNNAFVIVHEASDGIWTILSWWTGEVMLKTQTFHSNSGENLELDPLKTNGSMACVWEMAVQIHEREAWIEHVLKKSENPDYKAYGEDVMNTWI